MPRLRDSASPLTQSLTLQPFCRVHRGRGEHNQVFAKEGERAGRRGGQQQEAPPTAPDGPEGVACRSPLPDARRHG